MKLTPLTRYPRGIKDPSKALATLTVDVQGSALIFQLELTNRPDNRLVPAVVDLVRRYRLSQDYYNVTVAARHPG
jgi:hypothetical protein